MTTKMVLEDALAGFLLEVKEQFSIHGAATAILGELGRKKVTNKLMDDIIFELDTTFSEFCTEIAEPLDEYNEPVYLSCCGFFSGAKFIIKPTEYELHHGLLIPGHRMMPFINPAVAPWDVECSEKGAKPIDVTRHRMKLEEIRIYFTLMGEYGTGEYMEMDEATVNTPEIELLSGNPTVEVSVFECVELYHKHNMQVGDYFVATVTDWINGDVELESVPATAHHSNVAAIHRWVATLDTELEKLIDEFGSAITAEDQLRMAFCKGGHFMIENPVLHIGGFLPLAKKVHLVPQSGFALFWNKGEKPAPFFDNDMDLEDMDEEHLAALEHEFSRAMENLVATMEDGYEGEPEVHSSINAILSDYRTPVDIDIIEGWMRESVLKQQADLDWVLSQSFGPYFKKINPHKEHELMDELRHVWRDLIFHFEPARDSQHVALRSKLLSLYSEFIEFHYLYHELAKGDSVLGEDDLVSTLALEIKELIAKLNLDYVKFDGAQLKEIAEQTHYLSTKFRSELCRRKDLL